ncbi:putative AC transposase [Fusarium oxysporum f. sp. raphani]|uniref:Putative AC transposase n=1 Tax=Fusarium oxysporum f. sp. raphani TaxID=96318 RepID=A0A8J5PGS4_FUSOX|nr:putative AC transposase [Fusarium oxysporum f. sp. raphani]
MSSASPAPLLSEPSDELLGPASPGSPVPAKRTLDRSPSDRAGKRAKGRTNKSTWNEARGPYEERGEKARDASYHEIWYCKHCDSTKKPNSVTTNLSRARKHLRDFHGIRVIEHVERSDLKKQQHGTITDLFGRQEERQANRDLNEEKYLAIAINIPAFEEALARLLAVRNIAHTFIEYPEFHAVILSCNYMARDVLLRSRRAVPKLLKKTFAQHKQGLVKELHNSLSSMVHFTIDMWTSSEQKAAYQAIVVHFVDAETRGVAQALLSLREFKGSHNGKLQAKAFLEVVEEYDLRGKVGYFTMDNHDANDTMLDDIAKEIDGLDPVARRLRCSGHIMNLIVQAFLFRTIENAFARTTARQLQQVREHERNTLRSVINVDAFREAQMLLSAHRHLPLNFVTWPEYQALLTAVNPAVQEFLTDSGNTVAADLDRAYDAHQQSVKKWLEHARSLVHIAMDVWSSPQRKAYVAVHAQWVDEAYKPRKALLGLPNLRRSHAGAAMTPHLMEIIRKYHLAPRIGYFTGDNDAKNDTCLRQLAVGLSQEYGLTFDPVSSRTRCAGHIINLSLQAFLFATSEDALQAAIEQAQDEANDVTVSDALHDRIQSNTCQKSHGRRNKRNDTAGWRSIGPMGKLHNIAVFIRNSTVRNNAWDDIAGKALGIDNITRWNSWFKLLDAAISQEGPLSIFLNQYHEELEDDILTHDDWQVLKMTHEFLQPFYQATLEQQMEWASIDQVLENMDILFLQFENAKVKYVNNARMVNSVHMGWWVLSKYYEESDKNPIYATALLLHPEKRRRYLDRHWAEEWRQTAIAGARRHWAKYKDRPLSSDSAARLSNERREVTPYERIKQSMSVLDEPGDEDEFEKFVNSPPRHMTTNTPLEWWCREEQRIEYPRLHQMAIDILSVPAMSDDPERVFSCARRTISWDRARLSTDTIEKLQCLSNWVKNDLIRKLYVAIDDEIMVVAGDDDDIPDPSLLY